MEEKEEKSQVENGNINDKKKKKSKIEKSLKKSQSFKDN